MARLIRRWQVMDISLLLSRIHTMLIACNPPNNNRRILTLQKEEEEAATIRAKGDRLFQVEED